MYTPKKYIATIVDMPSHENYWDASRIAVKIKDVILIRFFSSHDIFYSIDNGFTGLQNSLTLFGFLFTIKIEIEYSSVIQKKIHCLQRYRIDEGYEMILDFYVSVKFTLITIKMRCVEWT